MRARDRRRLVAQRSETVRGQRRAATAGPEKLAMGGRTFHPPTFGRARELFEAMLATDDPTIERLLGDLSEEESHNVMALSMRALWTVIDATFGEDVGAGLVREVMRENETRFATATAGVSVVGGS